MILQKLVVYQINRRLIILLIFISLLVSSNGTARENDSIEDYVLKQWDVTGGLAHNTITCMLQSQSGYLWIRTPAGLIRFDGVQFKLFNRVNTPILSNEYITCIYEDSDLNLCKELAVNTLREQTLRSVIRCRGNA